MVSALVLSLAGWMRWARCAAEMAEETLPEREGQGGADH